jgi:hypothetical protein
MHRAWRHVVIDVLFNVAMHEHHDLLGRLRVEWRAISRSPDSRRAATAFALRHPELALVGVCDLGDLVLALEARGGRTVEQRAAIVAKLLEDAGDEHLRRALLQTLLPGVVSVARQLHFGRGIINDPSEVLDMAIATLSELLVDWAGQSRPYAAPDLLSALRGRVRRWLLKEKEARAVGAESLDREGAAPESSPLLHRLMTHHGGPHERLARLTYARVFEERPLGELAREERRTPGSLQAELQQFATRFLL